MNTGWSELSREEYLHPGHVACQGCGAALAMRLVLKATGDRVMVVLPAACWTIIDGSFPTHALRVPLLHTAFETAAAAATGLRAGLDAVGAPPTTVMAWAGDGGTFDIGFQAISSAAERDEDMIYVCYDNEAYMNTGIQRSSATPWGAWTATTPAARPQDRPKKDIVGILAAHRIPYAATTTVAHPDDLVRKVTRALGVRGFRFLHLLAPCPPGWKVDSSLVIKAARLAVASGVFPLYEVEDGVRLTLNMSAPTVPVAEYLSLQGRFAHLTEEQAAHIQSMVDARWVDLEDWHLRTHGGPPIGIPSALDGHGRPGDVVPHG
ncbi:MAG: pyruvate synthase subunit beta [Armatimonadetes bacterium]|nr:pyruvate synthase subunit beta [Armatimonadota bacterium]